MVVEVVIAVAILSLLAVSLEAGFRCGRRPAARQGEPAGMGQLGAIQGAMLGLLGLLLAFSFSGAGARFIERQDLIAVEANAIGTAYLRADLLDEPYRSHLKTALAEYVQHRLRISAANLARGTSPQVLVEVDRFHQRIWQAASQGTLAKPVTMVAVLMPVNETIDLHTTRLAAGRKHLPGLVMGLLIVCSALALGVIGFGCGLGGQRHLLMTGGLAILVAGSLWTTIDLDYPRAGLIRLSDTPLRDLAASFAPSRSQ